MIPVRRILWSRKWQPTPVFLPGKFYGQSILGACSPWGHQESDMTESTHTEIVQEENTALLKHSRDGLDAF